MVVTETGDGASATSTGTIPNCLWRASAVSPASTVPLVPLNTATGMPSSCGPSGEFGGFGDFDGEADGETLGLGPPPCGSAEEPPRSGKAELIRTTPPTTRATTIANRSL